MSLLTLINYNTINLLFNKYGIIMIPVKEDIGWIILGLNANAISICN